MQTLRYGLVLLLMVGIAVPALAQADFDTSLHKTRNGKNYWYGAENGGFEQFTNVPIEELGCVECHGPTDANGDPYPVDYEPSCVDCHQSDFTVEQDQCLSCHGRMSTLWMSLGYSDVHRDAGFVCWDCHTGDDLHGDGTEYQSMLEPGAVAADCEACHDELTPEHAGYDPHGGALHCTTCHAQTVISCYNCHFESQVEAHVKRAKQPLHDFVILANRDKDGKVYPMTFQSLTYQGNAFTAFGPFTSHTITREGRGCSDCHFNMGGTNAAIQEYNDTGMLQFASWDDDTDVLSWIHGVVPMPADYETSFKMDFITYDGDPSDPPGPSTNWSSIGKDTWDGHQMFFATPLTADQMAALGMDAPVAVEVDEDAPSSEVPSFAITGNFPNPFNPSTTISISLREAGTVRLDVYDVRGQRVRSLTSGTYPAGVHQVTWDGLDDSGLAAPSGTYVARLAGDGQLRSHKMVLAK
jgi:hypothetical protein